MLNRLSLGDSLVSSRFTRVPLDLEQKKKKKSMGILLDGVTFP